MQLIDTHCHFYELNQPENQLTAAQKAGIAKIILPASSKQTWLPIAAFAQNAFFYPAYGLHPFYASNDDLTALIQWLKTHSCIAIGECGLDYSAAVAPEQQKAVFLAQIELALQYDVPLLIHARKALEAVLHILAQFPNVKFIVHSFSGSDQQLAKIFALNGMIGIGGSCTYPRAQRLRRQIAALPDDRYCLETDAPYQPLCGYQGQKNQPTRLIEIAQTVATLRGCNIKTVAAESYRNTIAFFPCQRYEEFY
ncbi:TatD family hydrolase [Dichelobacter nodosus]|uniref:TatD family hydrolase n=1 Tax=Dichelobacter nodosus TaxID=870 RepID=UPI00107EDD01|nr:TatD family hydrolase [Dichelobacter nodosus]TGA65082.1 TatD family deoxyribonuclease [Dichelobacter nodosus]